MPRRAAPLLLPLLLAAQLAATAEVFVIADTANQTLVIAENARETIAEANNITLTANDTLTDSDTDSDDGEIVRKKRTFGDVVFRGIADVLGYNVARKPPQTFVFPPPLAPVPGIDTPLRINTQVQLDTPLSLRADEPLRIPFAVVPLVAATPVQAQASPPAAPPCGAPRAAPPCKAPAPPPPPPPKPKTPCPRARANPRPKPAPKPKPPPPCGRPRANPVTASPCAPPPPPPKADANLERISSNFRLDFNFNRGPAAAEAAPADTAAAELTADDVVEDEQLEQQQLPIVPIQPQAARLPLDPPRTPRVYLDAFVVRNGVANKVHAVDARNLNQPLADDDYLVYDEEPQQLQQPQQVNDYEYEEPTEAIREFGNAVDRYWDQRKRNTNKKVPRLPENDYRNVHFGDRDFANQLRHNDEEQYPQRERPRLNRNTPLPETDEENETTTKAQDPRKRLKPRVLPPTEQNPNQIDTITVRVPPIYKEKRPKKLHRERPERPERPERSDRDDSQDELSGYGERGYSYDSDTENTHEISQYTEKPKRKRRKKQRVTRSTHEEYTAGDFDYYGKKLPISDEEKFFRGLTIPPPTMDADVIRVEESRGGNGHFLDDHERLRDERERVKEKRKNKDGSKEKESEDSGEEEKERTGSGERSAEDERADETERSDVLSPNARVRETGYENNFVHATNVQVDDSRPLVATTVKKKRRKLSRQPATRA